METVSHTITGPSTATPEELDWLEQKVMAHNMAWVGDYKYTPLTLLARNRSETIDGGLHGHTGLEWLYIHLLWIAPEIREKGLGSRLLAAAETEAIRRGCRNAYLYSYSFQAPQFYLRHGYTCCCTLKDFPPGHSKLFFQKSLRS
jgi:GNAT superfamily N-acetyltransferase